MQDASLKKHSMVFMEVGWTTGSAFLIMDFNNTGTLPEFSFTPSIKDLFAFFSKRQIVIYMATRTLLSLITYALKSKDEKLWFFVNVR